MIPVQNVYHMLAYAFCVLREQRYADMATEEFDNAAELCAEILARGIESQIKRGLGREYVDISEPLSSPRGKIEISESIKTRTILKRQLICSFDEFSVGTRMNRILKATCKLLIRSDIDRTRKKKLKTLLAFFAETGDIDLLTVDWHMRFEKNNQTYRMLMGICWLVVKGLLQTQDDGSSRLMDFFDEQRMSSLYEKFILEYYRCEHPEISAEAPHIEWALDDGFAEMLPIMRSDVTLSKNGISLIIDAKYYGHSTQQRYDKRTVHSHNLYQIFAYVKNKEAELTAANLPHEVSGMLLYAKTDETVQPNCTYQMSGNQISVRTLDLNLSFKEIRAQLDEIIETHFPNA